MSSTNSVFGLPDLEKLLPPDWKPVKVPEQEDVMKKNPTKLTPAQRKGAWGRFAAAALTGILAAEPEAHLGEAALDAGRAADNMLKELESRDFSDKD